MSQHIIIQEIKLVAGVIPPIFGIILMIEGHFKVVLTILLFCRVHSSELPFVRSLAIYICTQSGLCI